MRTLYFAVENMFTIERFEFIQCVKIESSAVEFRDLLRCYIGTELQRDPVRVAALDVIVFYVLLLSISDA